MQPRLRYYRKLVAAIVALSNLPAKRWGLARPSNRPSRISARKAERIVSSSKQALIQGVLKSWITKKKHKHTDTFAFWSIRKAQQPDRFEHKKSTNKNTNTLGFWSTRKAQRKKHNGIVSSTRKAKRPDRFEHKESTTKNAQTYKHVWFLEHKKSTIGSFRAHEKHNRKKVSVIEIYCPGTPPSTKNGRRGQTQARPQPAKPQPQPRRPAQVPRPSPKRKHAPQFRNVLKLVFFVQVRAPAPASP